MEKKQKFIARFECNKCGNIIPIIYDLNKCGCRAADLKLLNTELQNVL